MHCSGRAAHKASQQPHARMTTDPITRIARTGAHSPLSKRWFRVHQPSRAPLMCHAECTTGSMQADARRRSRARSDANLPRPAVRCDALAYRRPRRLVVRADSGASVPAAAHGSAIGSADGAARRPWNLRLGRDPVCTWPHQSASIIVGGSTGRDHHRLLAARRGIVAALLHSSCHCAVERVGLAA